MWHENCHALIQIRITNSLPKFTERSPKIFREFVKFCGNIFSLFLTKMGSELYVMSFQKDFPSTFRKSSDKLLWLYNKALIIQLFVPYRRYSVRNNCSLNILPYGPHNWLTGESHDPAVLMEALLNLFYKVSLFTSMLFLFKGCSGNEHLVSLGNELHPLCNFFIGFVN